MEFFVCPCNGKGMVFIDGVSFGANKDAAGDLVPFECNTGLHLISLVCLDGKHCVEPPQKVVIQDTNPIDPQKVSFTCAP
jgi:hypothetical protein